MTAAPPPVPKSLNEFQRIVGVFVSPMATFADIARWPRWWVPMILLGLAATAYTATYGRRVGWDMVVRQTIEQSPQAENLSAAQREQAIRNGARVAAVVQYASVVGPALSIVIVSAILIFLIDSLMGGRIGFVRMLGIVGYARLPSLIFIALAILVMYLKPPDDFDLRNPLAFNLAALLPAGSKLWLTTLAASFDVFTFWELALTAAGISTAAPKIRFGKAATLLVILFLIYVALVTGVTAAFRGGA
jgi:hypothetical protein